MMRREERELVRAEKLSTIAVAFYTFVKDSPSSKLHSKADNALEMEGYSDSILGSRSIELGLYFCTLVLRLRYGWARS